MCNCGERGEFLWCLRAPSFLLFFRTGRGGGGGRVEFYKNGCPKARILCMQLSSDKCMCIVEELSGKCQVYLFPNAAGFFQVFRFLTLDQ